MSTWTFPPALPEMIRKGECTASMFFTELTACEALPLALPMMMGQGARFVLFLYCFPLGAPDALPGLFSLALLAMTVLGWKLST